LIKILTLRIGLEKGQKNYGWQIGTKTISYE